MTTPLIPASYGPEHDAILARVRAMPLRPYARPTSDDPRCGGCGRVKPGSAEGLLYCSDECESESYSCGRG